MRHAYVYYRVAPGRAGLAAARVERLMASVAGLCAVKPRRLVRCDDAGTWMEIYEGISDWPAFDAALESAVAAFGLLDLIDGSRHLECFVAAAEAT